MWIPIEESPSEVPAVLGPPGPHQLMSPAGSCELLRQDLWGQHGGCMSWLIPSAICPFIC